MMDYRELVAKLKQDPSTVLEVKAAKAIEALQNEVSRLMSILGEHMIGNPTQVIESLQAKVAELEKDACANEVCHSDEMAYLRYAKAPPTSGDFPEGGALRGAWLDGLRYGRATATFIPECK